MRDRIVFNAKEPQAAGWEGLLSGVNDVTFLLINTNELSDCARAL